MDDITIEFILKILGYVFLLIIFATLFGVICNMIVWGLIVHFIKAIIQ